MRPYFEHDGITIYHGDCREILPSFSAGEIPLVLSDPPYGVGVKYGPGYDDSRDLYWEWFPSALAEMRRVGRVVVFTHRQAALQYLTDWDWVGVWHKPMSFGARVGNSPVLPHWEPIVMYGIHSLGTQTGKYLNDVISCIPEGNGVSNGYMGRERNRQADAEPIHHPTPKPIYLYRHLVAALSQHGEAVCDPFMGSGTTLRAAKDLGRRAIGIDIEERYCEIAAKRMAQGVLDLGVVA